MTPLDTKLTCTRRLVLSAVLVAFGGILLNWPREGNADSNPIGSKVATSAGAVTTDVGSFSQATVSAGWPWTFYVAERSKNPEIRLFLQAALLNLAVLASVALLLGFGSNFLSRRWHTQNASRLRIGWGAGGGVALAGAGVVMFALTLWPQRAEIRNRTHLWRSYGVVDLAPWRGMSAAYYLPTALAGLLGDPQAVRLIAPSREAIDRLAETASLQSITLIDTDLSVSDLRRLSALPSLKYLALVRCPLTTDHCLALGQLPILENLEVLYCNGAQELLDPAIDLGRVTAFHLNELPWSAETKLAAGWAPRLQNLRLGFSAAHADSKLEIADLTELKQLMIYQSGEVAADAALAIRLARMPKLDVVSVPERMPISFSGTALTRLQRIDSQDQSGDSDSDSPQPLKFSSISLDSVPSLRSIHCDGDWLREIALIGTPSLDRLIVSPAPGAVRSGFRRANRKIMTARGAELIRQLAACDGPEMLDLSGLPLFGVDLSPLAAMGRIQTLSLARTGANASQIRSLSGLAKLKSLDILHCDIRDGDIETILAAFPLIQSLNVETSHVTRLEVVNHAHLKQLFGESLHQFKSLKVAACPRLSGHLLLGDALEKLEIRDAVSLTGLILAGRLPRDAVLEGFRDLEELQLGGDAVTDRILESFAGCSELTNLTLAYPALTSAGAKRFSRFTNLRRLILPGAAVDDSATYEWFNGNLLSLHEVDLSHTQIGGATLRGLVNCRNLQRLNIGHTQITASDLLPLQEMSQLYELEIAGTEITAELLERCLAVNKLDRLDLSDCRLDEELKQWVFVSPVRLLFLGLERCNLNDEDVIRLMQKSSKLALALDGNRISEPIIRSLAEAGRVIAAKDRAGYQRRIDLFAGVSDADTGSHRPQKSPPFNRVSRIRSDDDLPIQPSDVPMEAWHTPPHNAPESEVEIPN